MCVCVYYIRTHKCIEAAEGRGRLSKAVTKRDHQRCDKVGSAKQANSCSGEPGGAQTAATHVQARAARTQAAFFLFIFFPTTVHFLCILSLPTLHLLPYPIAYGLPDVYKYYSMHTHMQVGQNLVLVNAQRRCRVLEPGASGERRRRRRRGR